MRKLFFVLIAFLSNFYTKTFADTGIFGSCVDQNQIRTGDIHIETIPCVIRTSIDFFMGIAGTISIIFIIIGAYQMLFGSLQKDVTKGRNTIIYSLAGFALAACSWLIIKFILDNFG
nr:hypothetical protein [Candidatus Gracilibacteria bacterium]